MSSIVHVFDRVRATGYNCLVVRRQCPLRVVFCVIGHSVRPRERFRPLGTSRQLVRYRGMTDSGKLTARQIYGFTA
jgi:hypothetical protein